MPTLGTIQFGPAETETTNLASTIEQISSPEEQSFVKDSDASFFKEMQELSVPTLEIRSKGKGKERDRDDVEKEV